MIYSRRQKHNDNSTSIFLIILSFLFLIPILLVKLYKRSIDVRIFLRLFALCIHYTMLCRAYSDMHFNDLMVHRACQKPFYKGFVLSFCVQYDCSLPDGNVHDDVYRKYHEL